MTRKLILFALVQILIHSTDGQKDKDMQFLFKTFMQNSGKPTKSQGSNNVQSSNNIQDHSLFPVMYSMFTKFMQWANKNPSAFQRQSQNVHQPRQSTTTQSKVQRINKSISGSSSKTWVPNLDSIIGSATQMLPTPSTQPPSQTQLKQPMPPKSQPKTPPKTLMRLPTPTELAQIQNGYQLKMLIERLKQRPSSQQSSPRTGGDKQNSIHSGKSLQSNTAATKIKPAQQTVPAPGAKIPQSINGGLDRNIRPTQIKSPGVKRNIPSSLSNSLMQGGRKQQPKHSTLMSGWNSKLLEKNSQSLRGSNQQSKQNIPVPDRNSQLPQNIIPGNTGNTQMTQQVSSQKFLKKVISNSNNQNLKKQNTTPEGTINSNLKLSTDGKNNDILQKLLKAIRMGLIPGFPSQGRTPNPQTQSKVLNLPTQRQATKSRTQGQIINLPSQGQVQDSRNQLQASNVLTLPRVQNSQNQNQALNTRTQSQATNVPNQGQTTKFQNVPEFQNVDLLNNMVKMGTTSKSPPNMSSLQKIIQQLTLPKTVQTNADGPSRNIPVKKINFQRQTHDGGSSPSHGSNSQFSNGQFPKNINFPHFNRNQNSGKFPPNKVLDIHLNNNPNQNNVQMNFPTNGPNNLRNVNSNKGVGKKPVPQKNQVQGEKVNPHLNAFVSLVAKSLLDLSGQENKTNDNPSTRRHSSANVNSKPVSSNNNGQPSNMMFPNVPVTGNMLGFDAPFSPWNNRQHPSNNNRKAPGMNRQPIRKPVPPPVPMDFGSLFPAHNPAQSPIFPGFDSMFQPAHNSAPSQLSLGFDSLFPPAHKPALPQAPQGFGSLFPPAHNPAPPQAPQGFGSLFPPAHNPAAPQAPQGFGSSFADFDMLQMIMPLKPNLDYAVTHPNGKTWREVNEKSGNIQTIRDEASAAEVHIDTSPTLGKGMFLVVGTKCWLGVNAQNTDFIMGIRNITRSAQTLPTVLANPWIINAVEVKKVTIPRLTKLSPSLVEYCEGKPIFQIKPVSVKVDRDPANCDPTCCRRVNCCPTSCQRNRKKKECTQLAAAKFCVMAGRTVTKRRRLPGRRPSRRRRPPP